MPMRAADAPASPSAGGHVTRNGDERDGEPMTSAVPPQDSVMFVITAVETRRPTTSPPRLRPLLRRDP